MSNENNIWEQNREQIKGMSEENFQERVCDPLLSSETSNVWEQNREQIKGMFEENSQERVYDPLLNSEEEKQHTR